MTHIAQQGINWPQMVPWSDPKTTQIHMGEAFKTCGICGVEATLGPLRRVRKSILRLLAFLAPAFLGSWWFFLHLGSTWGSKWTPGSCPNGSFFTTGSTVESRRAWRALLFEAPGDFFWIWGQHGAQNGVLGRVQMVAFLTKGSTVHSGVLEGLGCRNYCQIGLQCIHVIKIGGS